jgi:large subunit ribosomal protein L25
MYRSMADQIQTEIREKRGTKNARRLRQSGKTPAILYGHGQDNVALSIETSSVQAALRRGQRLVELAGAVTENAFIRDVQWDTFGLHVLHMDLTRVVEGDTVEIEISIELRGSAPGIASGGVVSQLVYGITLECPVMEIPEKLEININELELDEVIVVGDIDIPENCTLITDPETSAVQCLMRLEEEELEEEGEEDIEGAEDVASSEPELIGKPDDEGEGDSEDE